MKANDRWWIVLVQAIVAVAFGVFMLANPGQATTLIGLLAAAYLLISGLSQLFAGTSNTSSIRGIVGVVIGAGLILAGWFNFISLQMGYTLLAAGLIVYGALGLWAAFFDRGETRFSWGPILVNALLALWGVAVFFSRAQEANLTTISGWILVAIGVVVGAWAFLTRSKEDDVTT